MSADVTDTPPPPHLPSTHSKETPSLGDWIIDFVVISIDDLRTDKEISL